MLEEMEIDLVAGGESRSDDVSLLDVLMAIPEDWQANPGRVGECLSIIKLVSSLIRFADGRLSISHPKGQGRLKEELTVEM